RGAAALAACAVVAIANADANAGEFTVMSCRDSPTASTSGWSAAVSTPDKVEADSSCTGSADFDGLAALDRFEAGVTPDGSEARWIFTASGGTTINRLTIDRYV